MSSTIRTLFFLLMFAGSANAFWIQGTAQTVNFNKGGAAGAFSPTLPCNVAANCTQVTGKSYTVIILVRNNQSALSSIPAGYTELCSGPFNWDGATGWLDVIGHPSVQGESNPSFNWSTQTTGAYMAFNYFGVDQSTPVDKCAFLDNGTGTALSAPDAGVPTYANDEDLLLYVATGTGSNTMVVSAPTNVTTSGTTTIQNPISTTQGANPPSIFAYEVSMGPLTPTAPGATGLTSDTSVANAGLQILFKSMATATFTAKGANAIAKASGVFSLNGIIPQPDITDWVSPFLDGSAMLRAWNKIEPTCHVYNWDFIDGFVLNSKIQGVKLSMAMTAGVYTPSWVFTNTACSGGTAASGVNVRWSKQLPNGGLYNFAVCTPFVTALPWDTHYEAAYQDLYSALGTRYAANSPNIVALKNTEVSAAGAEVRLTTQPADGASMTCNDTPANCNVISGVTCAPGPTAPCTCNQFNVVSVEWPAAGFTVALAESGYTFAENAMLTAFPGRALEINANAGPMPAVVGTTDTFNADLQAYDKANYPGQSVWISDCIGANKSGIFTACNSFIPVPATPLLSTGRQTNHSEWAVNTTVTPNPQCNAQPPYSLAMDNCFIPAIFSGLADGANVFELYVTDLQTTAAQPWAQLASDVVTNRRQANSLYGTEMFPNFVRP